MAPRAIIYSEILLCLTATTACERYVPVGHEILTIGGNGAGAGTPAVVGGAPGDSGAAAVPWSADHELGTLDEWLDDDGGWRFTKGNGTIALSQAHARSGSFSLEATISTDDGGMHQAVMARDVTLESGRYGAWYFFPEAPNADYWVVMKLSNTGTAERFDIDVHAPDGSEPRLRLFEHGEDWISEPAALPLPIGRWVHIEALYRSTPDDDGRLSVLQDGQAVLDTGPRSTSSDARVSFVVGSVAWHIAGGPYSLYIDDASIEAEVVP